METPLEPNRVNPLAVVLVELALLDRRDANADDASTIMSTKFSSIAGRSVLAASAPVLEHAVGRDQPLTPRTGDELAGDQWRVTPATVGTLLSHDPRRPDGMRALPAGLRDHLRQQVVFPDRTLVVSGLHDQPIFHEEMVASRVVRTQSEREDHARVNHLSRLEDAGLR